MTSTITNTKQSDTASEALAGPHSSRLKLILFYGFMISLVVCGFLVIRSVGSS